MCNKSQGFYGLDGMLSPAAQAIMVAWEGEWSKGSFCHEERSVAAALRAAVDQVVPEEDSYEGGFSDSLEHQCRASERRLARAELLALAAELEGTK
jgi:hypothetical protein